MESSGANSFTALKKRDSHRVDFDKLHVAQQLFVNNSYGGSQEKPGDGLMLMRGHIQRDRWT